MATQYGGKLSPRALREKAAYIRDVASTLADKQAIANLVSYARELEAEAASGEAKGDMRLMPQAGDEPPKPAAQHAAKS